MCCVYKQIVDIIADVSPVFLREDLDCDIKQLHTIHQEAKLRKIAEVLRLNGYFEAEFIAPEFTS